MEAIILYIAKLTITCARGRPLQRETALSLFWCFSLKRKWWLSSPDIISSVTPCLWIRSSQHSDIAETGQSAYSVCTSLISQGYVLLQGQRYKNRLTLTALCMSLTMKTCFGVRYWFIPSKSFALLEWGTGTLCFSLPMCLHCSVVFWFTGTKDC